jgi:hypothetical protein
LSLVDFKVTFEEKKKLKINFYKILCISNFFKNKYKKQMKINIVYFTFLVANKWIEIVTEQLNMLKSLDLYNEANIFMSVNYESHNELETLKKLLDDNYSKIKLINISSTNQFEYGGIKTVYDVAENDNQSLILYFHSKGMSSNQHDQRKLLFNHTIENYKIYIQEFKKNPKLEVAGAIPSLQGFIYFNFFWVRSNYVYKYCSKPENTPEYTKHQRYTWEMWLGHDYCNKKNKIITYSPLIKYFGVDNNVDAMYTFNAIENYNYNEFDDKNVLFNILISPKNFEKNEKKTFLILFIIFLVLFIIISSILMKLVFIKKV